MKIEDVRDFLEGKGVTIEEGPVVRRELWDPCGVFILGIQMGI